MVSSSTRRHPLKQRLSQKHQTIQFAVLANGVVMNSYALKEPSRLMGKAFGMKHPSGISMQLKLRNEAFLVELNQLAHPKLRGLLIYLIVLLTPLDIIALAK
jgi:hypothetical protein